MSSPDASSRVRLVAAVGPQSGPLKTRHAIGIPGGPQEDLPFAQLLVLERAADGIYLYRYTADGDDCGDTWHESVEDAQAQAEFEYEAALGKWYDVPPGVEDVVVYAETVGLISRPEV